mmetsp:Transcript_25516/g.82212  ORF Transcript_25516/g.82212 Transcript_25516/m.82212 type:complete len:356 (-) Transcript_25516:45-1112(-)|eukprot:CAMPEP_0196768884 /NCGR_PEP_ID=MMETSP1104-20130614/186_1 /TAXON_ID=33652 /ORGANISM="Cafeteria sp., Strain Caron Lab Isolate" /LENGTH=355 /DNA_ID=CAMNT_0042138961 /DNA_START=319 /DNA_END=1386 /DNA_ORIENTATION=+
MYSLLRFLVPVHHANSAFQFRVPLSSICGGKAAAQRARQSELSLGSSASSVQTEEHAHKERASRKERTCHWRSRGREIGIGVEMRKRRAPGSERTTLDRVLHRELDGVEEAMGLLTETDVVQFATRAVGKVASAYQAEREVTSKLMGKHVTFVNPSSKSSTTDGARGERRGPMAAAHVAHRASNRQFKRLLGGNMKRIEVPAETVEALRGLWATQVAGLRAKAVTGGAVLARAVLRVDLIGAELRVSRSRTESMVGKSGVVLLESARSFLVAVAGASKSRVWLKKGSVFALDVCGASVELHGAGLVGRECSVLGGSSTAAGGGGGGGATAGRRQQLSSRASYTRVELVENVPGSA